MISADLLEILACPACDARPRVTVDGEKLVCSECKRRYQIRDGIPVMLVDEAELPAAAAAQPERKASP